MQIIKAFLVLLCCQGNRRPFTLGGDSVLRKYVPGWLRGFFCVFVCFVFYRMSTCENEHCFLTL